MTREEIRDLLRGLLGREPQDQEIEDFIEATDLIIKKAV